MAGTIVLVALVLLPSVVFGGARLYQALRHRDPSGYLRQALRLRDTIASEGASVHVGAEYHAFREANRAHVKERYFLESLGLVMIEMARAACRERNGALAAQLFVDCELFAGWKSHHMRRLYISVLHEVALALESSQQIDLGIKALVQIRLMERVVGQDAVDRFDLAFKSLEASIEARRGELKQRLVRGESSDPRGDLQTLELLARGLGRESRIAHIESIRALVTPVDDVEDELLQEVVDHLVRFVDDLRDPAAPPCRALLFDSASRHGGPTFRRAAELLASIAKAANSEDQRVRALAAAKQLSTLMPIPLNEPELVSR